MAERLFNVEVIVFKRNIDPAGVNEQWPDQPKPIDFRQGISVHNSNQLARRDILTLPKHEWQLTEEFNKLRAHAGFTPLLHAAWQQNDRGRAQLPKIIFRAGQNYRSEFNADGTSKEDYSPIEPETDLFELDGYIRLYVQHYLFIETDLILRTPTERKVLDSVEEVPQNVQNTVTQESYQYAGGGFNEQERTVEATQPQPYQGFQALEPTYTVEKFLKSYTFEHKRRMRSGEVHYLDHPMMGLIIKVTRV